MTLKPCTECGEPSSKSRCPEHRPKDTKPSRQARGYDAAWQRLGKRARRQQPWCEDCGSVSDLQCDHKPSAWQRKAAGKTIRLCDVAVVCGPCNRRRGAARRRCDQGECPNRLPLSTRGQGKVCVTHRRGRLMSENLRIRGLSWRLLGGHELPCVRGVVLRCLNLITEVEREDSVWQEVVPIAGVCVQVRGTIPGQFHLNRSHVRSLP